MKQCSVSSSELTDFFLKIVGFREYLVIFGTDMNECLLYYYLRVLILKQYFGYNLFTNPSMEQKVETKPFMDLFSGLSGIALNFLFNPVINNPLDLNSAG